MYEYNMVSWIYFCRVELKDRLGVDRHGERHFSSLSLPGFRASTSIIGVASSSYFGIVLEGSGVDILFYIKHLSCCYLFLCIGDDNIGHKLCHKLLTAYFISFDERLGERIQSDEGSVPRWSCHDGIIFMMRRHV